MTRQQRRAAERQAQKTYVGEVIIYDEVAESLKHLYLPPAGSYVTAEELQHACARLAEATVAMKQRLSEKQERPH